MFRVKISKGPKAHPAELDIGGNQAKVHVGGGSLSAHDLDLLKEWKSNTPKMPSLL
jgi:hypothetical protein